jgi:peptide/nickel transport system substrate-binding protein
LGLKRRADKKRDRNITVMTKHRLLAATALSTLMLGAAPAMAVTVTMNTVQIFGTIDPAKISDYTDYMAAVNL